MADDFYEADEPVTKVQAAFDAGEKGITAPREPQQEPAAIAAWLQDPAFQAAWEQADEQERARRRLMVDDWMATLPPPVSFGKVRIIWPATT